MSYAGGMARRNGPPDTSDLDTGGGCCIRIIHRRRTDMTKSTVTRLFVGSVIAVAAGLVLGLAAVIVAFGSNSLVMSGPDVVGIEPTAFAWSMVALAVVGVLAIVGGAIGGLVSWIGALLNTAELEDKTWFVLLLILGILSFGLVAMIAYVIAGPDGTKQGCPVPRRPETPSRVVSQTGMDSAQTAGRTANSRPALARFAN